MKKCLSLLLFVCTFSVFPVLAGSKSSPEQIWQEINDSALRKKSARAVALPQKYRTFRLNKSALKNLLVNAAPEFSAAAPDQRLIVSLPMPDGTLARFGVEESPIMEPELAAQFPEIKTYRGQGLEDPTATVRFDLTPHGFHSMILAASGTVLVDPYSAGDTDNYISYFKSDATPSEKFVCHFGDQIADNLYHSDNYDFFSAPGAPEVSSGTALKTYRIAVAATGEYTAFNGGTVALGQAAIVTVMNRVNGVYERDVATRMTLVGANSSIVYTNATTDPYTNNNPNALLTQNQANLTAVIGSANYDIGHVFSTAGGGLAGLGVTCSTSRKAEGETGTTSPVGDPFAIDYVAHEIGHQFGGNHTFNASDGNREASAAYEPGSGITIMGYAGLFGAQDLAGNSIDTFHVKSIEEIIAYKTSGGLGCGTTAGNGNSFPTVTTASSGFTIPANTPFALTANATDANNDALTYDWQEYDLGAAATGAPNTDASGARPIFRPYLPTTSSTRYFPSLNFILNNANVPPNTTNGYMTGERLPSITRTMNFQVIVRDNRSGGGGVNTATATVNVVNTNAAFAITAPNTNVSWGGGSAQTITWNVAGTTANGINAANVKISLSTDGGQTFPTTILASTPNDGSQSLTIPNIPTQQARIKVEGVNNIFFDVSNANFTILAPTAAGAAINGRAVTESGRGIRNIEITLTDSRGQTRTTKTTAFGYYQFEDVAAGETYVITASGKQFDFAQTSHVVNVSENVTGLDFIGTARNQSSKSR